MARKLKQTQIPWLGEIPDGWGVKRLKEVAKIITGNTPSKDDNNLYYSNKGLMWIKPDNLFGFDAINDTAEYLNEEGIKLARIVPPKTPLICCIGSIGKFGYSNQESSFNQQINAVAFDENFIVKSFQLYLIFSLEDAHWFYANGNVVKILNTENQKQISIPIPPLDQQEAIAKFLDEKCAMVDELVKNTKEAIAGLKEMKKSIITEAVTKGLEKDAKLKQTQIPWLGEIPEGWGVGRHKNYINLEKGRNPSNFNDNKKGLPYIGASDFDNKEYTNWTTDLHLPSCKNHDILILWDGARAGIVDNGHTGIISSTMVKVNIKSNLQNQYYFWLSKTLEKYYIDMANGTTIPHMSKEFVNNATIPLPPLPEQEQIAKFLDEKCAMVDELVKIKEEIINRSLEFKKSLIYEYVTGKKEIN